MRKISLIITLMICCFGCKKEVNNFTLKGELTHLTNDTILIYSLYEGGNELDTIYAKNGKFSYTCKVDTITPYVLLFNGWNECLLYADKGLDVSLSGDASFPELLSVIGAELNEELNQFKQNIAETVKKADVLHQKLKKAYLAGNQKEYNQLIKSVEYQKTQVALQEKAADFIATHPSSLTSIALLEQFFIEQERPDYLRIKEVIKGMSGELLDHSRIKEINEWLESMEKVAVGKHAPYFTATDQKGKILNLSTYKEDYLLICFWASWYPPCKEFNNVLKTASEKYKKKNLSILSVSLDVHKQAWEETIRRDTLSWNQVCDFKAFSSDIPLLYGITHPLENVLIDPDGMVIAKNLQGKELLEKLTETFK